MKLRLPVLIIALALMAVVWGLSMAFADVTLPVPVGTGPYVAPAPTVSNVYFHIGALNLTVPWDQVNVVYLYDLQGKRNLVGGEAVVATLWHFEATAGAVTTLDGNGAPFIGGNLWFPNPVPQLAVLNSVKPGVFGGYDWNRGAAMFGFKAAVSIF